MTIPLRPRETEGSSAELALDLLFSTKNPANARYLYKRLYKYHKLYTLLEQPPLDSARTFYVHHEDKKRYYVFNPFLISLLRDGAIWFSPGSAFNDPWDAGHAISIVRSDKNLEAAIVPQIFTADEHRSLSTLAVEARYDAIELRIRAIFQRVRFACFSRCLNSASMWAHYADNHHGACMMFEFFKWNAFDYNFRGGYAVRYSSDYAQISEIENFGAALTALYTKSAEWSNEKEVRFMHLASSDDPQVGLAVQFQRRSLTHLILGYKVPRSLWRPLRKILDAFQYSHVEIIVSVFNERTKALEHKQMPREANIT